MRSHQTVRSEQDILDNPSAGRVQKVSALTRRATRKKYSRFLAEGPQAVREAVRFAAPHIKDLYLTDEAAARHSDILREARAAQLYIHRVTSAVMHAMSPDAQGTLAVLDAAALRTARSLTEVLEKARLVAVLTETQDPGNAGTIIRAADAAGADAVILAQGSVDVTSPKVVRSTAGSLFHLPIFTGSALPDILRELGQSPLTILAADAGGEHTIFTADQLLAAPSAWLLGNEAHGFSPATLAAADAIVSVPIYGHAESLNVATAATICLYASARAQHLQAGTQD